MTTPPIASDASAGPAKRAQAETLLADILKLMDYPAKLEFKDMPDGGIGVAVHLDATLPGVAGGKKSFLMESLQFLVNKVVNRPQTEKHWVTLGLNAFPEPRSPGSPRAPLETATTPLPAPAPAKAAPAQAAPPQKAPPAEKAPVRERGAKPADKRPPQNAPAPRPSAERRGRDGQRHQPDELSLEVAEDATVTKLAKQLAEKSAAKGRVYAVTRLSLEDRARFLKAAQGTPGVRVKVEGDGHFRRVVFTPDKLTPILKRSVMPDFDDDEE